MVLDDESDDGSIGAPKVSYGEPLIDDGTPDIPIPYKPPHHQSSYEYPEGSQPEEAPEGATPGRPIWARDKNID